MADLASKLGNVKDEDILSADYKFADYDPELIKEFLYKIHPANALFIMGSNKFNMADEIK